MAYELALRQDIQEKVRNEIKEILKESNGEITYDAISKMKYLDMVFNETARKHPITDRSHRKCMKDFKIPGTNLTIEKGMWIIIPTASIHLDERFWNDPEKFDPERFNEENIQKILPGSYQPFSMGPR